MNRPPSTLAGIALVTTAVAFFASLDTITKVISSSVPVLMALWFRYAFQAVATTVTMLPKRGASLLRTAHPKYQCLRGALLLMSSTLAFFSLRHMPVAEFTAIVMLTPLVITLLASTALKEKVSPLRWALVIGGFLGTMVIIRPSGESFTWAMLLPIALVAVSAWFQILTSRLARTEDPFTTHFYSGWVGTLAASIALPFVWVDVDAWQIWLGLFMMGLLGTVGHFMLILAYARAPAATLTPFLYGQIGFAMLGGWLIFSHLPDRWSLLGIAVVTVCGAMGAWLSVRENRAKALSKI